MLSKFSHSPANVKPNSISVPQSTILLRLLQPENASPPIDTTLAGIITHSISSLSANVSCAKAMTLFPLIVSGIETVLSEPIYLYIDTHSSETSL